MTYKKGQYGYIGQNKKKAAVMAGAGLFVILAVFFAGLIITKTRLNWFTFAAVLCAMPVGRMIVNLIMVFPRHSMDRASYEAISSCKEEGVLVYDLVVTSYEGAMQLDAVFIKENTVCAYTGKGGFDFGKAEKFVKDILANNGCSASFKIYSDLDKFTARIREIRQNLEGREISESAAAQSRKKEDKIRAAFLAISL